MQLLDLLLAPWAIEPAALREIQAIYATHLRGEKIDLEALEARLGRPLANDQQEYRIEPGGVAVLQMEGVMAPKANMFMRISGGTSTQIMQQQIESAIADPRVRSMVLAVDSPGGSVFGTPELAKAIFDMSQIKPIVAVSEARMASAAYWAASAANAVFVSGPTVEVGSIGVVGTHNFNPRGAEGVTEITAGKYKRIATSNAPLSKEGRAYLQAQVDHVYTVFVNAVAEHRGAAVDTVLEHMADGRVFIGQQAIDVGLVDGVSTVADVVDQLAADPTAYSARRKARVQVPVALSTSGAGAASSSISPTNEGNVMPITREQLTAEAPDLLKSVLSEGHTVGAAEGATAERTRIQGVLAQSIPGHEAVVNALAFDGKSTAGDAAQAVLAAERKLRADQAAANANDAPRPVPTRPAATVHNDGKGLTRADLDKKAREYQAAHPGVEYLAAVKQIELTQGA